MKKLNFISIGKSYLKLNGSQNTISFLYKLAVSLQHLYRAINGRVLRLTFYRTLLKMVIKNPIQETTFLQT